MFGARENLGANFTFNLPLLRTNDRYTGHFTQTVIAHPQDNGVMIKSVGALLVIGKGGLRTP